MNVIYVNHKGTQINLSQWPVMISEPETLLEAGWSYSQKGSGIVDKFFKEGKEVESIVQVFADSKEEYTDLLNTITQVTEIDVINLKPGTLYIDDYYLQCYIVGWQYEEYEEDFYSINKRIRILAEKWIWIKETTLNFRVGSGASQGTNLDYKHDYPYDYSNGKNNQKIINSGISSCGFEMTIYGPCTNPFITIAGHIYSVDTSIDSGEYLKINSKTRKIYKTKVKGETVNQFSLRNREYDIFRKIPEGSSNVSWDGTFGFDITLLEERSEPKWI